MSSGPACQCVRKNQRRWRVVHFKCNYSAFSGYHYTSSNYSQIKCLDCGRFWRTKAAYVDDLSNYQEGER